MRKRNPLQVALGKGSAKSGVHHWWMQRLSAVALVPLTLWIIASMIALGAPDHATASTWLAQPLTASLVLAWVWTMLYHAQLGVQVVIEDYVHDEGPAFALLIATKLGAAFAAVLALISVLKIVFAG